MLIQIDHASDRSVYQQIVDHVKREIALGKLIEGDRLPTVRELSGKLVINPNTIAKAYRQLEQEGVIVTRAGAGAFVSTLDTNLSRAVRRKIISEQFERAIVEAVHMQATRLMVEEWFDKAISKFKFSEDMREQS
jgi:GntR family transcriptional regulator